MWTRFIDAHLHLQDKRFVGTLDKVLANAEISGVCRLFCNATQESDWQIITALAAKHHFVIPFLGIHPWFAHQAKPGWDSRLHTILKSCENGAGIGEIGLDKKHHPDLALQRSLMEAHLEIAADLGLPVSIHCVHSWGALLDIIETRATKGTLPQTLIHSFSGSRQTMERLVAVGCFVSYAAGIADASQTRLREIFFRTPIESLLLETDAPDQLNPNVVEREDLITSHNEPTVVAAIYRAAADLKQIHIEDLTNQLWENATIYAHKALAR